MDALTDLTEALREACIPSEAWEDLRLAHLGKHEATHTLRRVAEERSRRRHYGIQDRQMERWRERCAELREAHAEAKAAAYLRGEPHSVPPLKLPERPEERNIFAPRYPV